MAEALTYLYAITRGTEPDLVRGLEGIAGSGVRWIEVADLGALVSDVDEDEFGEAALRRNLEDLEWLGTTVRAHNRVVEAAAAALPVAPMGLATVYYGDDRVRERIAERAEGFESVLDRVTGRTEWGVKAFADLSAAPADPGEPESERPGTAYLRKVRHRTKSREESKQEALQQAADVHASLAELAEESRTHPPQSRELAGYDGVMVLNGAYLVDDARADLLVEEVRELAERHPKLRVELTGPWPPYSFATILEDERETP
ncbi:GvpL/GvpF family gas vesicle protein [Saccharopolyspora mangrovi]|uniref:GvpL/GvpF family gas vesicle protein n=1 Tax=Saccharopolyspora mangrovi TaxID=3082379 RepID=A0ABU6ACG7_9PSEU|nr:GvpL/GvpF family gas vesicle protein [Saccharopolyspora sp. S2-29]MEB3369199.1 GvpL/GvpF family gas vesicle protein [Saccharopolyspora sp. S2-29]